MIYNNIYSTNDKSSYPCRKYIRSSPYHLKKSSSVVYDNLQQKTTIIMSMYLSEEFIFVKHFTVFKPPHKF